MRSSGPQRVATILFLLGSGACGGGGGDGPVVVVARIGPAGGTITTEGQGLRLDIPTGALAAEAEIRVAPAAAVAGLLDGTAFDLQPAGLHFARPATLTIRYPAGVDRPDDLRGVELLPGAEPLLELSEQLGVDAVARTVSAHIDGFSTHGVAVCGGCVADPPMLAGEYHQARTVSLSWAVNTFPEIVVERAVVVGTFDVADRDFAIYAHFLQLMPSFVDAGIGAGAGFYWYQIRGRSGAVVSAPSNRVRLTVFGVADPPGPPTELGVTPLSGLRMQLTWRPDPLAVSYTIQRRKAGAGDFETVGGEPATSPFYFDTYAIEPRTTYEYRVRAENAVGASVWVYAPAATSGTACRIEVTLNGAVISPPVTVPAGAAVDLDPHDCGQPGDEYAWYRGPAADQTLIAHGASLHVEVESDERFAIVLGRNGAEVDGAEVALTVVRVSASVALDVQPLKPRPFEVVILSARASYGQAEGPVLDTLPSAVRTTWAVVALDAQLMPVSTVWSESTTTSSALVGARTLSVGWYQARATVLDAEGNVVARASPHPFEVVEP